MAQHKMAFNLGTDETNKEYKNFPKPPSKGCIGEV
jgi:hypothetical protein